MQITTTGVWVIKINKSNKQNKGLLNRPFYSAGIDLQVKQLPKQFVKLTKLNQPSKDDGLHNMEDLIQIPFGHVYFLTKKS